jgi:hypothetical protein
MRRRLLYLITIPLVALGLTMANPTAASAAPTPLPGSCTNTGTIELPKLIVDQWGNVHIMSYTRWSYVGSVSWLLGTHRIWHVSIRPANSAVYSYLEAYAALCNGDQLTSTVDLTRTADETITSPTDLICGTTNFTAGSSTYTYIGSRFNNGDTFRYWRRSQSSTNPPLFFVGPYAARCA